jgi:hypothetical protein
MRSPVNQRDNRSGVHAEHVRNAQPVDLLADKNEETRTFVEDGVVETEVRQGREALDVVGLGQFLVVDLDEADSKVVRVIVDVL